VAKAVRSGKKDGQTMSRDQRRTEPISPIDCKHHNCLLVECSTGGPPHRDHTVYVCPRCGQFQISASEQGVQFRLVFELPTRRLVEAAGRYCEYLELEELK
jgi:predicted RNA-binding Zn-ribbon protein involved in translation (DUF1610 family)